MTNDTFSLECYAVLSPRIPVRRGLNFFCLKYSRIAAWPGYSRDRLGATGESPRVELEKELLSYEHLLFFHRIGIDAQSSTCL